MKTKRLFRPVGKKELQLILDTNMTSFPPRLDWQPIFYPVLNYAYAEEIAVKWNLTDSFSSYCGFVTSFDVDSIFLDQYEVQNVGNGTHNELWIPAEDLDAFNENIEGRIQIVGRFYGKEYTGLPDQTTYLAGLSVLDQITKIMSLVGKGIGIKDIVEKEKETILFNWSYWQQYTTDKSVMLKLEKEWKYQFPEIDLNV
jgi:hypothetical protein